MNMKKNETTPFYLAPKILYASLMRLGKVIKKNADCSSHSHPYLRYF